MKILYHHRTQSGDAQGIHINEMVKAFRDLGHEVMVVSPTSEASEEKGNYLRSILGWMVKVSPVWCYELMGIVYNVYGYWTLLRTIRKEKPDFIYERYSLNTFWSSGFPKVWVANCPGS